jgi:glycerol-3-phosphate dehydrogenase
MVRARDTETGREFEIHARQIVNATGVWTDDTQAMVGERGQFHFRASKGIHILVPRNRIRSTTGLILKTKKSVLFVIPWGRHWIIGTTDTDWNLDKAHPAATRADIDYLLEEVNTALHTPLTGDDVEGVWTGLRPLLAGESDSTSKLSREHLVAHSAPGLVVVAGGKFTTYRVMAEDAVDAACSALGDAVPESVTKEDAPAGSERLRGHVEPSTRAGHRRRAARCPRRTSPAALWSPHPRGAPADDGRSLPDRTGSGQRRLCAGGDRLRCVTRRCAASGRHPDPTYPGLGPRGFRRTCCGPDCRRTARLGRGERTVGGRCVPAGVAAERESQTMPDDESADAIRLAAPEVTGHRPVAIPAGG